MFLSADCGRPDSRPARASRFANGLYQHQGIDKEMLKPCFFNSNKITNSLPKMNNGKKIMA